MAATEDLLRIEGLTVAYRDVARRRHVRVVDEVSLRVGRGEAVGLAGESGCGKSTTALAILDVLPRGLRRTAGAITLSGRDRTVMIHRARPQQLLDARWDTASVVFQGAMNALSPVHRVGDQIADAILTHRSVDRGTAQARVAELLELVGIPSGRRRDYPHEFSGGMRQRSMIALALACEPELLIADEPTTALDVVTQAQILELLRELRRELDLALLLISHDLSLIAENCDRVAIMYAGQIVEEAPTAELFGSAAHPYSRRLLSNVPRVGGPRSIGEPIPGAPPDPANQPEGCRFSPRCPHVFDPCNRAPALTTSSPGRLVRCHLWDQPSR
jgi:oligopeptide/dipeptide ABC transporter ATP-binding protein